MDFSQDDEQKALRDAVRGLTTKAYGEFEQRRRVTAQAPGFDEDLWGRLAEMGVLGLPFSEDDGGVGAGPVEVGIVAQELGRVLAPEPFLTSVVHAGGLVAAAGTDEQRADLLGRLSAGEVVLAVAEGVDAGHDAGAWSLSGVSDPVPNGARADHLVVVATLPDGGSGLFVVAGDDTARTDHRAFDGGRAAQVAFEGTAAVPLGQAGLDQSAAIEAARDLTRIMAANQALGVMQSQVAATTGYLKSRKQFGVTLNTFQALTFRAADMYVSLELTHSMVDWATMVAATGDAAATSRAADRVGLQVSRAGRHIGQEAIQLHGGIAMTAEYAVGVGTAHLVALAQSYGGAHHHLTRLADGVREHGEVEALA